MHIVLEHDIFLYILERQIDAIFRHNTFHQRAEEGDHAAGFPF